MSECPHGPNAVHWCRECSLAREAHLRAEIVALRDTLSEIAAGRGRFSLDPLTHASNCISEMITLAQTALGRPVP